MYSMCGLTLYYGLYTTTDYHIRYYEHPVFLKSHYDDRN